MSTTFPSPLPNRTCGVAAALDIVGERWAFLILREILFGNRRFGEIATAIGAPRDRLAARLKLLVSEGVLERQVYQEHPRREEYVLTAAGEELTPIILALFDWGTRWGHFEPGVEITHGDHPAAPRIICATCGEPIVGTDLHRHAPGEAG